ncbi:hypothetical protein AALC17_04105 [Oscillospiraceae bacterium 38-13]
MLKRQIARSNNGIVRSKYITFDVPAEGLETVCPRLERASSNNAECSLSTPFASFARSAFSQASTTPKN